jgi:signal transduction histidine kinase
MIDAKQEYKTRAQLYCYSDELRQVFANLIGNALDATPEGERVRIRIQDAHSWDRQQKRGLRVVVADTGHGIPVELRKRIFEPFVSTKDDTGTGLGLWVTETILQKHGGRISLRSVTSGPNRGTVFSLFFPFSGIAPLETTQKK